MASSSDEDFTGIGNDEQCPSLDSILGFGAEFEEHFGKEGLDEMDRCIGRDVLKRIIVSLLGDDDGKELIQSADAFFKTAHEHDFTIDSISELVPASRVDMAYIELVPASCLYLAFREKSMPFLLIDIANCLRVTIHELGLVYLRLRESLNNANCPDYQMIVEELTQREQEYLKMAPRSNEERVMLCMHEEVEIFGYGLCETCYSEFVKLPGELGGASEALGDQTLDQIADYVESEPEGVPEPAFFRRCRSLRQVISDDDE